MEDIKDRLYNLNHNNEAYREDFKEIFVAGNRPSYYSASTQSRTILPKLEDHNEYVSPYQDLAPGSTNKPILPDPEQNVDSEGYHRLPAQFGGTFLARGVSGLKPQNSTQVKHEHFSAYLKLAIALRDWSNKSGKALPDWRPVVPDKENEGKFRAV